MSLFERGRLTTRALEHAPTLAALAASLLHDLEPLLTRGAPWIPPEKAKLTRSGGRCRADGTLLDFDPFSPRRHRCPRCGRVYDGEVDYRWWVMNYQLWLAERAVIGAALAVTTGNSLARTLAREIIAGYAERYLSYPNADNVLGPSRLFFSTYLESIWLLQLSVALDLLETTEVEPSLGPMVRERVLEPAARLIGLYDEGASNRQVWNNAALAAAARLLDDGATAERAVFGPSGLTSHLASALLPDGTWYEGENYHLFAHRGLWYGVTQAEAAGLELAEDLLARFHEGFATPFASALPDFTFPSRRDSQYAVSLRQWRTAESCELGLARRPHDTRLRAALRELYRADVPPGPTGRDRSTAESERNVPPARLDRSSLGWKALLFALRELPPLASGVPTSSLLEGQGLGILRRENGRIYVALDYGHSGAGHGHPDRLNAWLVVGDDRFMEDVGTGSYVERTLHWYRSTLAHNAPLVNGESQWKVHGRLLAYEERGDIGWIRAEAEIAPGVIAQRALVVAADHVIDELTWRADAAVTVDLPLHVAAELEGIDRWRADILRGGAGTEDGFTFVAQSERAHASGVTRLTSGAIRAAFDAPAGGEWWRAVAPGPPGQGGAPRAFLLRRGQGERGRFRAVYSWAARSTDVTFTDDGVTVAADGTRYEHHSAGGEWRVSRWSDARGGDVLRLAGNRRAAKLPDPDERSARQPSSADPLVIPVLPRVPGAPGALASAHAPEALRFALEAEQYRRSEASWREAGSPTAVVAFTADRTHLIVDVLARKEAPVFLAAVDENPLDNEHPDTNSDGLQLYLLAESPSRVQGLHSWILVPEEEPGVRVTPRLAIGDPVTIGVRWRRTPDGYAMRVAIPRAALGERGRSPFHADIIVNETAPGRERRRGQLVLSGADGGWVYLRGDRQDVARFLPLVIRDA